LKEAGPLQHIVPGRMVDWGIFISGERFTSGKLSNELTEMAIWLCRSKARNEREKRKEQDWL
jgi:hypothetical protein